MRSLARLRMTGLGPEDDKGLPLKISYRFGLELGIERGNLGL